MSTPAHPHPWTAQDAVRLSQATAFAQIGDLVVEALGRSQSKFTVLSGPISTGGKGSRDENLKTFGRAIDFLVGEGLTVFSQMPMEGAIGRLAAEWRKGVPRGTYCQPIISEIYVPMFVSGRIERLVLLPDWQTSEGARQEVNHCRTLGIEIVDIRSDWETQERLALAEA